MAALHLNSTKVKPLSQAEERRLALTRLPNQRLGRLLSSEASWALAILADAAQKLDLLCWLDAASNDPTLLAFRVPLAPYGASGPPEGKQEEATEDGGGDEGSSFAIRDFFALEGEVQALAAQVASDANAQRGGSAGGSRPSSRASGGEQALHQDIIKLEEAKARLATWTRAMARLVGRPETQSWLQRWRQEQAGAAPPSHQQLVRLMRMLCEHTNALMRTTEQEQHRTNERIIALTGEVHDTARRLRSLRDKVGVVKPQHARVLHDKRAQIDLLRQRIKTIRENEATSREVFARELADQAEADEADFERTRREMAERLSKLRHESDTKTQQRFEKELALHLRKYRRQQKVDGAIEQYDADMLAKDTEMRRLREQYAVESEERERLEAHFKAIDDEAARRAEEERRRQEEFQKSLAARRKRNATARLVQDMFRLYASQGGKKKKKKNKNKEGGMEKKSRSKSPGKKKKKKATQ